MIDRFLQKLLRFNVTFVLTLILLSKSICGQSDFKLAVSCELSLGTFLVVLNNFEVEPWSQNVPVTIHLVPKLQLRWKNLISLNVGGGMSMYNYSFDLKAATYNVTLASFKLEGSVLGYIPFEGRKLDAMNLGCGIGMTALSGSERTTKEKSFIAKANTPSSSPMYIMPQIGTYIRDGRFGYSVSIQYTKYLTSNPIISFNLSATNSLATASHSGDYFGLNIIVDYDLSKDKPKKIVEPEPVVFIDIPDDVYDRKDNIEDTFTFNRKKIRIYAWDHSMIDHDTISLLFNGRVALSRHHLDHKKKKIEVELKPGTNELLMYAHNEGSISPNSAAILIRYGLFRKKLIYLNASYKENAVLKLKLNDTY
jgi:hypothetical protein